MAFPMNFSKTLLITSMIAGYAVNCSAEIYRWVDDQGNVEFSDEPRQGSEKIEVGPTATITLPKPEDVDNLITPDDPTEAPRSLYTKLEISFPEDNSAFNSGNGDVSVTMLVEPSLLPNHSLRLTMDGTKAVTTKANFYTFPNVDRGTHNLRLDIVDNTSIVKSGPSVNFTVHRPSVLK